MNEGFPTLFNNGNTLREHTASQVTNFDYNTISADQNTFKQFAWKESTYSLLSDVRDVQTSAAQGQTQRKSSKNERIKNIYK